MTTTRPLLLCTGCDGCGAPILLVARIDGRELCAECWKKAGSPFLQAGPPSFESEEATRRRMLARGGSDRNLVLKGRA